MVEKIRIRREVTEWRCGLCNFGLPWQSERGTPDESCPCCQGTDWRNRGQVRGRLYTDAEVSQFWDSARRDYDQTR